MASEPSLVSVIVPTRNCGATIERCLRSVMAQTYPNIELIVVDNGSTDGTVGIASRYARVYQAGPERCAQVNHGARQALGNYLYRIDGDFELDPGVVEACVTAIERDGNDALVVPNLTRGEGYWARVRALERDTYIDDDLIAAARFWKRSAFEAVGGFDESLVACEDYDLHNRLLAAGYRIGRVKPPEYHLGEASLLWSYARQGFYYGPSVWRYLVKHPRRGLQQMMPLRPSYIRHRQTLLRQPALLLGLLVLKLVQYLAAVGGMIANALGLVADRGRLTPVSLGGFALCLAALWSLGSALARLIPLPGRPLQLLILFTGLCLWQACARRRARLHDRALPLVLPEVALALSPLLLPGLVGTPAGSVGVSAQTWLQMLALALAVSAAWLTYLSRPAAGRAAACGPGVLLAGAGVLFVGLFTLRAWSLLHSFALTPYDLAVQDQALWALAHGQGSEPLSGTVLFSSLTGRSLFASNPAPILLLLLPTYLLGIGSPLLLSALQNAAVAAGAPALYLLGRTAIGRWPAALVAVAYLACYTTWRVSGGSFVSAALAGPFLLWALVSYRSGRQVAYYVLLLLTLACGIDASLCVAVMGAEMLWLRRDRLHGSMALALGLAWAAVALAVLAPFFGGTVEDQLAPYGPSLGTPYLVHLAASLIRPQALNYVVSLLAPLGFLSLLGWPALVIALPRVLLNLLANGSRYTAQYGWFEFTITPFLFLAALEGIGRLARWGRRLGWASALPNKVAVEWGASVLVAVGCVTTALLLAPGALPDVRNLRLNSHQATGYEVLAQIPADAMVAAQAPYGLALSHRRRLTVLPQVDDADYVLFDLVHPDREPAPKEYEAALQRIYLNPAYGLRLARDDYLLFQRGLDAAGKRGQLTLSAEPSIKFPHRVEVSGTVAYLGFDLSATQARPGQPIYLTHYWQSLAPADRPYLLFTAYPGARLFENASGGLLPVSEWRPGEIVRHQQVITLPALPDGDGYEIAVGLWYGQGEPELTGPQELLGHDVIRIAALRAGRGRYEIIPWPATAPKDTQ